LRINACHVHGKCGNFFCILDKKLEALAHKKLNLEEVRRDHDGDDILFGEIVLHELTLFCFLLGLHGALLQIECPALDLRVQLIILGHAAFDLKNVIEEPLEDLRVTVNRNIDLILVRYFLEALIEILHVSGQKRSTESEIFLDFLVVVDDVDHDLISENHFLQGNSLFSELLGVLVNLSNGKVLLGSLLHRNRFLGRLNLRVYNIRGRFPRLFTLKGLRLLVSDTA